LPRNSDEGGYAAAARQAMEEALAIELSPVAPFEGLAPPQARRYFSLARELLVEPIPSLAQQSSYLSRMLLPVLEQALRAVRVRG
jgi:hypothetical protein